MCYNASNLNTANCKSKIKSLKDQFDILRKELVNELKERSGGKSVTEILNELTMISSLTVKDMYDNRIQAMLSDLENIETVDKLFFRLNPLFTFIDYDLLEHLITRLGSPKLKQDMSKYVHDLKEFKKEATVADLFEYEDWPGHRIADEDSYFAKFVAKFEGDPNKCTLEELDKFKRLFFSELRLSVSISVFILKSVEPAMSFYAVWHIPAVIVPYIIEAERHVDSSFYAKEGVVIVSLDGKLLYPHVTKPLSSAARFTELSKSMTKTSYSTMQPQQRKQKRSLPEILPSPQPHTFHHLKRQPYTEYGLHHCHHPQLVECQLCTDHDHCHYHHP